MLPTHRRLEVVYFACAGVIVLVQAGYLCVAIHVTVSELYALGSHDASTPVEPPVPWHEMIPPLLWRVADAVQLTPRGWVLTSMTIRVLRVARPVHSRHFRLAHHISRDGRLCLEPGCVQADGAPVRCNESESTEVGHGRDRHQRTELRQVEHRRAFTFDSSNRMSREISPALEIVCVEDKELVHLA